MAKAETRFGSSSEREDALGKFDDEVNAILLPAMKKALKNAGLKFTVEDDTIIITKKFLEDETWETVFYLDNYSHQV